jgi:protein transport protein SEC24
MDLASLGTLCKYTCGQLYFYPQFNAAKDAPKLRHELHHNLTRTTGAHSAADQHCPLWSRPVPKSSI